MTDNNVMTANSRFRFTIDRPIVLGPPDPLLPSGDHSKRVGDYLHLLTFGKRQFENVVASSERRQANFRHGPLCRSVNPLARGDNQRHGLAGSGQQSPTVCHTL